MSDESISGSDPDLDPDLEQEDMEEEEEEDDEAMEEDNDGDDEEDLLDENDQPQEDVFSNDHVQHGDDGEWQRSTSTTSSQSEQAERLLQNQHKSLASEDTKKKRAQKPSHMRRNIRKLLREDQLEAVTKAAQLEELERRKRLEQQRKDYPAAIPTVPLEFLPEEIVLRTAEATHLPPQVLAEEVICLDSTSSGSEDDTKGILHSIKDEVIELSSGEDEALQIVDSSDSANEGEDGDGTEESSGSHVNDTLNQSDSLGQVIVNINHPPNEEDIFLAPQLARAVKPHQVQEVEAQNTQGLQQNLLLIPGAEIHAVDVMWADGLL